jgi:hypothetical protein
MVTPNRRPIPESDQLPRVPVELYDLVDERGTFYSVTPDGLVLRGSRAQFYAQGSQLTPEALAVSSIKDPGQPPRDLNRWQRYAGYWDRDLRAHVPGARDELLAAHPELKDPRLWRRVFEQDQEFQAHIRAREDNS